MDIFWGKNQFVRFVSDTSCFSRAVILKISKTIFKRRLFLKDLRTDNSGLLAFHSIHSKKKILEDNRYNWWN